MQTLNPETGGVVRAVVSLAEAMERRGVRNEVVTLDDPASGWLTAAAFPVHALGRGRGSYSYSSALRPWLEKNAERFDRVVVHGLWQHPSFAVRQVFFPRKIPYFVFPHGMLDPWFKRTFPLKHLKKWLYWPWGEYRVLRDAAAVIFTSEEERRLARESFWLYCANERISPLGAEAAVADGQTERELFLARFPQIADTRMLLFLGRIHPKKGCDLLLDAFPRGDGNLSLVLAGPDQWGNELRARVVRQDLSPRIIFPGMLQGALKCGAFACADAFILPSHQENFGISVVEALSYGVPVLISDRINIWREIEADRAGYVESDDLAGTTRLIERWLATSADDREKMRANARRCFLTRFEIGQAAESLLHILQTP
ncbi:MAG: glycosyltransferase [Verrucomicrobiota bacterium]|nr:glycosyltransferase [Verrucomicrobiota bacterium]